MNSLRRGLVATLLMSVILAAVAPIPVAAQPSSNQASIEGSTETGVLPTAHVQECADTPPANLSDPDANSSEVVGWVGGFWYNETLPGNDTSGEFSKAGLRNYTARTAARVEVTRCLTFEELPPLNILTRDDWRERIESRYAENFNENERLFARAQLATMFFAGHNDDTRDVLIEHETGFPAAFYDTREDYMGFITEDPDSVEVDEVTLAHELTHALQDQHFDIESVFEEPTTDERMSSLAVVEGDAELVASTYEDACGEWVDGCIRVSRSGDPSPAHWGLTLESLAVYHSQLVAHTHERRGWDGVNELIANPPNSMIEALQPERYKRFLREPVAVLDRSSADWRRVRTQNGEFDIVGQHGLTAMLVAPAYESQGAQIVDIQPFIQSHQGGQLNYNHPLTEGWRNDKFYAYARSDGRTASVWVIAWSSDSDAEEFADAYRDLVEFNGGRPVSNADGVFHFNRSIQYDMAVGVERNADRVRIVTAPNVEALEAVDNGFQRNESDDVNVSTRVAELETEVQRLEAKIAVRDRRIQQLQTDLYELQQFRDRVEDTLESEDLEKLDELIDRLEKLEENETVPAETDGQRDDTDNSIPGFGPLVGFVALLIAGFGLRYLSRGSNR